MHGGVTVLQGHLFLDHQGSALSFRLWEALLSTGHPNSGHAGLSSMSFPVSAFVDHESSLGGPPLPYPSLLLAGGSQCSSEALSTGSGGTTSVCPCSGPRHHPCALCVCCRAEQKGRAGVRPVCGGVSLCAELLTASTVSPHRLPEVLEKSVSLCVCSQRPWAPFGGFHHNTGPAESRDLSHGHFPSRDRGRESESLSVQSLS